MAIENSEQTDDGHEAVAHGRTLYVTLQAADDPMCSAAEQTRQILNRIDEILAKHNIDKWKLLTAHVFISDWRHIAQIDSVWDLWVPWHDPPVRTSIAAKLQNSRHLVGIQVTAAL